MILNRFKTHTLQVFDEGPKIKIPQQGSYVLSKTTAMQNQKAWAPNAGRFRFMTFVSLVCHVIGEQWLSGQSILATCSFDRNQPVIVDTASPDTLWFGGLLQVGNNFSKRCRLLL